MKLCLFILFVSFQQQIYGRSRHAIDDNLSDGDEMNLLRGDAVLGGEEENKWFKAISPATLDKLITEMNSMNRWFAKVVKYWDDFTAGNNGAQVLKNEGKGIKDGSEDEEGDGVDGANTSEGPEIDPIEGDDPQIVDGDIEEKSGDEEKKPKDDEEENKNKDDGEEKPYGMADEKSYDEKTEENKDKKGDKEEVDKKSEDEEKSDEKGTADDEEKDKDEEDKKSEKEETRRRRRRRF